LVGIRHLILCKCIFFFLDLLWLVLAFFSRPIAEALSAGNAVSEDAGAS